MSEVLEILEGSREMLYRAAYDSLPLPQLLGGLGQAPEDIAENRDFLRRRSAMDRNCFETTVPLQHAVDLVVQGTVRRERHFNWEATHYFLSLAQDGDPGISDDDIVIDPTYLQFSDLDRRPEVDELPIMFIGLRRAIIEMMRTPLFGSKEGIAQLYMAGSLSGIQGLVG